MTSSSLIENSIKLKSSIALMSLMNCLYYCLTEMPSKLAAAISST